MQSFLLLILAIIWLGNTWIRIYKQARFYQIEEYMSQRYLRWVISAPQLDMLPARPISAWFVSGLHLAFLMGEAPDSDCTCHDHHYCWFDRWCSSGRR